MIKIFALSMLCNCIYATDPAIVQTIIQRCPDVPLLAKDLAHAVSFIEHSLPAYIHNSLYYISRELSELAYDIEYDPHTTRIFLHLPKALPKDSHAKRMHLAIAYDITNPQLVVVITTNGKVNLEQEINTLQALQHIPGVPPIIGTPRPQELILPFYSKGDIKTMPPRDLSLREKISLAVDLMQLLMEIHALGIIHDDVHIGNLLLDTTNSSDIRYRLILIDWEKAHAYHDESYLVYRDIYYAGISLYYLLSAYNPVKDLYKQIDQKTRFFADPLQCNIEEEAIFRRKTVLGKKKNKDLSLEEQFEYAILKMIACDPLESAAYWHRKFAKLLTITDKQG